MNYTTDKGRAIYYDLHKVLKFVGDNDGVTQQNISRHFNKLVDNPQVSFKVSLFSLANHDRWSRKLLEYLLDCNYVEKREISGNLPIKGREDNSRKYQKIGNYHITINGLIFLTKGGYEGRFRLEKNEFWNQDRSHRKQIIRDTLNIVIAVLGWIVAFIAMIFQTVT